MNRNARTKKKIRSVHICKKLWICSPNFKQMKSKVNFKWEYLVLVRAGRIGMHMYFWGEYKLTQPFEEQVGYASQNLTSVCALWLSKEIFRNIVCNTASYF